MKRFLNISGFIFSMSIDNILEVVKFKDLGWLYSDRKTRKEIDQLVELYYMHGKPQIDTILKDLYHLTGYNIEELRECTWTKAYLPNILHNFRIIAEKVGTDKARIIAEAGLDSGPYRNHFWDPAWRLLPPFQTLRYPAYAGEIAEYLVDISEAEHPERLHQVRGFVVRILASIMKRTPAYRPWENGEEYWKEIKEYMETIKKEDPLRDTNRVINGALKLSSLLNDATRPFFFELADKGVPVSTALEIAQDPVKYSNIKRALEKYLG